MSQEKTTVNRRRRTRGPRHRPVLVTPTAGEVVQDSTAETETLEPVTGTLEGTLAVETPRATPVKRLSRLPNFFSKVKKEETDSTTNQQEVIDARMARAKKGTANTTKAEDKEEASTKEAARPTAVKKATPQRPPSLFKFRHVAGMMAYLLGAQLLLPTEQSFLVKMHFNPTLTPSFSLLGFQVTITLAFLLNIATLVVLLYLLVHFDLLPNSKQFAAQQAKQRRNSAASNSANAPVEKQAPPTIRAGVKGEDDDLYQAYRLNQRREKKH